MENPLLESVGDSGILIFGKEIGKALGNLYHEISVDLVP